MTSNVKPIKSLDDVKRDMSELYDQVRDGTCDLKLAGELANITGKYLKAVQLDLATDIFLSHGLTSRLALADGRG